MTRTKNKKNDWFKLIKGKATKRGEDKVYDIGYQDCREDMIKKIDKHLRESMGITIIDRRWWEKFNLANRNGKTCKHCA
mgnify:CR=1 FL=1